MRILVVAVMLLCIGPLRGQSSDNPEVWLGYITSWQIGPKLYLWNDFHYVTESFWIDRHGLSWQFEKGHTITGGFAFLLTATSYTTALVRDEYRPWCQYEGTGSLGEKYGWRLRLRYDHRIRREIENNDLTDDFIQYNRWRLMATLRRELKKYSNGNRININLHNEILFNQGEEAPPTLVDQYRLFLLMGFSMPHISVQAGLHDRMIPNGTALAHKWGFTIWVTQRFNNSKFEKE